MAGDENTEHLTITAEAGQAIAEFEKLKQKRRQNHEEYKKFAKIEGELSESARAGLERVVNAGRSYDKQIEKVTASLKEQGIIQSKVNATTEQASRAQRQHNFQIMGLAGAIDDFVTVSQMQDWTVKGIIAGAMASANNLSVVLAMINPWLSIIPPLTTALFKVGYSIFAAGDEAAKSGDKFEEAGKKYQKALDLLDKFRLKNLEAQQGKRAVDREAKDVEFQAAVGGIDARVEAARQKMEEAKKEPEFFPGAGVGPAGAPGGGVNRQRREKIAQANAEIAKAEEERAKLNKEHQADMKRFDEQTAAEERKLAAERLKKVMGSLANETANLAGQMIAGGANAADVEAIIRGGLPMLGADQAGKDVLEEIMRNARAQAVQDRVRDAASGKGPKSKAAKEAADRARREAMAAQEVGLDPAIPEFRKKEARERAARARLEAQQADLEADNEVEANKGDVKGLLQNLLTTMQEIRDDLRQPPPADANGNI